MRPFKIFYIPGWASGRLGQAALLDELRRHYEVEILWLPDFGDAHWTVTQPAEMIYTPALIKRLEKETSPVAIVGWSMGGMVAMEVAAARPAYVKSLVLISTTAKFCADASRPIGSLVADLNKLIDELPESPDKALRRFFTMCYRPDRPERTSVNEKIREALDASTEQLALGLTYLQIADLRPIISRIVSPSLILHGDEDIVVPVQAGQELQEQLADSRIAIAAGKGHLLPDHSPDFILRYVLDFISPR